jgi:hypothetical protein
MRISRNLPKQRILSGTLYAQISCYLAENTSLMGQPAIDTFIEWPRLILTKSTHWLRDYRLLNHSRQIGQSDRPGQQAVPPIDAKVRGSLNCIRAERRWTAEPRSHLHQVGKGAGIHLFHDFAPMCLDGDLANSQLSSDLLIQQAGGN